MALLDFLPFQSLISLLLSRLQVSLLLSCLIHLLSLLHARVVSTIYNIGKKHSRQTLQTFGEAGN